MAKDKRQRRLLALTGAAALAAVAVNLAISAVRSQKKRRKRNAKEVPEANVLVNLSASEIEALADSIISESRRINDTVASIPIDKISYHNVVLPLAELEAKQFPMIQSCIFPKMVSVSSDVRNASAKAEKTLDAYFSTCRKREDIYRLLKAFLQREHQLDPETEHFVDYLVREFERNGAGLNLTKRKEMESLKFQIDDLCLQYIDNLKNDNGFLLLDEQELAGVPLEFIKRLEKSENGKFKIFLKSSHVSPILEYCQVGATRKTVAMAHGQRCGKENLSILENLVQLRHTYAELLGYSSYADYALEHRMVKTSKKVYEFLEDLSVSLTDLATQELHLLTELKKKEEGNICLGTEDILYYMRRAEEQYLDLDFSVINRLFPVTSVLSGVFKIYQNIFALEFREMKDVEVWHDSIQLFSVHDSCSHDLLGYFYLDMFSREGKYTQTCVLALQNGCLLSNARQIPIALLICQFPKQIDETPAFLHFSEVVSLFHEFGHVVQLICNRSKFARFSGLRIANDLIEIPGHMLENWCYESVSLEMVTGHGQESDELLTSEMCNGLRRKRDSFFGLKLKQEIFISLVDQIIYSHGNLDIVELVKHLHPKVLLGIPLLEGTNPASCFPRLAVGSEASCYVPLWSEVFATDIFQSKFQNSVLSQHAGLQFRNKVFAHGGAKDPLEILRDYLGREPSSGAYVQCKSRYSLGSYFSPET